jgi:hypothetical protein
MVLFLCVRTTTLLYAIREALVDSFSVGVLRTRRLLR